MRQIVCGAHNFQAGDTVAVSLSGAVLENGLKLQKADLRGIESDGMMMSEQELGYEEKSPGIVVLPGEWPVGAPLQDYLPVSRGRARARADVQPAGLLSIYGIAREVAAAARLELAPPPIAAPASFGGAPAAAASPSRSPTRTCARGTAPPSSAASRWASRRRGSRRASRTPACGPSATWSTSPTT